MWDSNTLKKKKEKSFHNIFSLLKLIQRSEKGFLYLKIVIRDNVISSELHFNCRVVLINCKNN